MTRHKTLAWAAFVLALVVAILLTLRDLRPEGQVTRLSVPTDSLTAFARCMRWSDAIVRRIARVPHYVRYDNTGTYTGATNGQYIWVAATADRFRVLQHEWTHIAIWGQMGSDTHRHPTWTKAMDCGASMTFVDLLAGGASAD